MSQTFIPGYLVAVTLDADTVIGLTASTYEMTDGPDTLPKRTFGAPHGKAIAGQAMGTVTLAGHATVEALPLLAAIRASAGQPVAVQVTYGTGGADAFDAVLRVTTSADAEGEVDWSLEGDLADAPTYTPPA